MSLIGWKKLLIWTWALKAEKEMFWKHEPDWLKKTTTHFSFHSFATFFPPNHMSNHEHIVLSQFSEPPWLKFFGSYITSEWATNFKQFFETFWVICICICFWHVFTCLHSFILPLVAQHFWASVPKSLYSWSEKDQLLLNILVLTKFCEESIQLWEPLHLD